MRLIAPLVLFLLLTGAGVGAGLALRPAPDPEAEKEGEMKEVEEEKGPSAFARLGNQFVVPVLDNGEVSDLVVITLSVEVTEGSEDLVYTREPKLRDAFLRVLFEHANAGGFGGDFTETQLLDVLREHLRVAAIAVVGDTVIDVLIIEVVRQEV
ncbi:flagellar basal body-associated FliL family protein [Aestuariibius sp. 2305UL40-4]|uniref:flagellar basal body-associated FliL family protein n=1 Tax=Aestuariibius violaceus TaxID=3234132 RepID=UPI00345EEA47